jgi:hypothetical protein
MSEIDKIPVVEEAITEVPETQEVATDALLAFGDKLKELTDEEKKAIFIEQLKQSKIKFHPLKHGVKTTVTESTEGTVFGRKRILKSREIQTNITVNQFGADYRKKRQRKNKMQKASRKANR